jgi:hypothetical protein
MPPLCWRPVIWFLPPLSLQPSLLPSYLGAVDLGPSTIGFGTAMYRHLQGKLVLPSLTTKLAGDIMERSAVDLGLDPASLLPAVLTYSVRPDKQPGDRQDVSHNNQTPERGLEDVKKLTNWCGEISALKKVAPGCPVSDRWGVGIHFAST